MMQNGHLCSVFLFIKETQCFVKYLYDFKTEINLINGTELLIFILLVCKQKPLDSLKRFLHCGSIFFKIHQKEE